MCQLPASLLRESATVQTRRRRLIHITLEFLLLVRPLFHLQTLRERVVELIPAKQKEMKDVMTKYGDKSLGQVTVSQAIGGARDVKCMMWETSLLDSHEVSEDGFAARSAVRPPLRCCS